MSADTVTITITITDGETLTFDAVAFVIATTDHRIVHGTGEPDTFAHLLARVITELTAPDHNPAPPA